MATRLIALALLYAVCGCARGRDGHRGRGNTPLAAPVPRAAQAPQAPPTLQAPSPAPPKSAPTCEERIRAEAPDALDARALAYADNLPRVIVASRVTSVAYLRWPEARDGGPQRRGDVARLLKQHRGDRAALRDAFLRDGYLFHDNPQVARAMVESLTLRALFDAPAIYRDRDGAIEQLVRRGRDEYVDRSGARADLFLNDRLAESLEALAAPRHVSLDAVRREAESERVIPFATGANHVAVRLVFSNGAQFDALASQQGRVECVTGDPARHAEAKAAGAVFHRWYSGVVEAARAFVREGPAFDEPLDEPEGVQEDGTLRSAWRAAYLRHQSRFQLREVKYPVFTRDGHALLPQVCVDFVLDTWERGGGTWYRPRGRPAGRDVGTVDFAQWPGVPRRSVGSLLRYIAAGGTPFERYDVPAKQRVPLRAGPAFARAVASQSDAFRVGDALVIYGLRRQDMQSHFHSVVVIAVDPWTGVPSVVADNQRRPRFGSLTQAMRAAPLRSIQYRIRFNPDAQPVASTTIATRDEPAR